MRTQTATRTLWVCIDCMTAEANGQLPEDAEELPNIPWSLWGAVGGSSIVAGLGFAEHDKNCANFDEDGNYLGETDEHCETQDFSWLACDGCGSTLGGSRHAYTVLADEPQHVGHFSRLGGAWWCDTCDSPYCELA